MKRHRNRLLKTLSGTVLVCMLTGEFILTVAVAAEREHAKLIDAARREGEIMWYTTIALDDSSVFVKKFMEQYPFINVKLYRANNARILERALAESRAKSFIADVISAGGLPIGVLKERGLLGKYLSREAGAYPTGAREPDGYWVNTFINTFNLVYNTNMVHPSEVPKGYLDLLDPKWGEGKMAIEDSDYEWFGSMLQIMGEGKGLEFMRGLSAQSPTLRSGHSLLASLVAAGEFALYPDAYPRRV